MKVKKVFSNSPWFLILFLVFSFSTGFVFTLAATRSTEDRSRAFDDAYGPGTPAGTPCNLNAPESDPTSCSRCQGGEIDMSNPDHPRCGKSASTFVPTGAPDRLPDGRPCILGAPFSDPNSCSRCQGGEIDMSNPDHPRCGKSASTFVPTGVPSDLPDLPPGSTCVMNVPLDAVNSCGRCPWFADNSQHLIGTGNVRRCGTENDSYTMVPHMECSDDPTAIDSCTKCPAGAANGKCLQPILNYGQRCNEVESGLPNSCADCPNGSLWGICKVRNIGDVVSTAIEWAGRQLQRYGIGGKGATCPEGTKETRYPFAVICE